MQGRRASWQRATMGIIVWLGGLLLASAPVEGQSAEAERQQRLLERYERMVQFNLDNGHVLPSVLIDAQMREVADLSLGERIAAWADLFHRRGDANYRFGLGDGGYVEEGRLVNDFSTDCILFLYRTTELGRTTSAREAVDFAYGTRFAGASLEGAVQADGRVDYDDPVHLDYSIDMIRSGIWGQEITPQLGETERDLSGTTRYPAGTVKYVPKANLTYGALRSGDLIFFVTDEKTKKGAQVREHDAVIGHVGVIKVEEGQPYLIHPASAALPGVYEGGKLVKVLLKTYLDRVESFKGVAVTRIQDF